jgi:hypothetical protein
VASGDPYLSQSWNSCSSARGNPLRAVDPTGLHEEDVHRSLTTVLALAVGFDANGRVPFSAISLLVQEFNDARLLDEKADIIQRMELLVRQARQSSQDP